MANKPFPKKFESSPQDNDVGAAAESSPADVKSDLAEMVSLKNHPLKGNNKAAHIVGPFGHVKQGG